MADVDIKSFKELNQIAFKDQSLLLRALTHPSYLNENPDMGVEDNQRLEFLGDAILDFISGELLYHRFPEAPEGRLTRLRAALVRRETLADFARDCHINGALLVGHGEAENRGRERDGNLCAAFEAVIGALYLDQGMERTREFVTPLFVMALENIVQNELDKDAKSQLQEWTQRYRGVIPAYETIGSTGPDHAKEFTVAVILGNKRVAEGVGSSKQSAGQMAAEKALLVLREQDVE